MEKTVKILRARRRRKNRKMVDRGERRIFFLSKDEVERFFAVIPTDQHRDRLLFDLVYRYGLRRGEAAALRLDSLSEGRIWIARLKGGVSSDYPVHPSTRRLLWAYLAVRGESESPYLLVTRQSRNQPISASLIALQFRTYAVKADLPLDRRHVHVFRHSIAVHLMNAGLDIADVRDWLGHQSLSSTLVYAQITGKRRAEAYERALASGELAVPGGAS
jgi:site-specific recombinase XerD